VSAGDGDAESVLELGGCESLRGQKSIRPEQRQHRGRRFVVDHGGIDVVSLDGERIGPLDRKRVHYDPERNAVDERDGGYRTGWYLIFGRKRVEAHDHPRIQRVTAGRQQQGRLGAETCESLDGGVESHRIDGDILNLAPHRRTQYAANSRAIQLLRAGCDENRGRANGNWS
jgi:hypothetical protein